MNLSRTILHTTLCLAALVAAGPRGAWAADPAAQETFKMDDAKAAEWLKAWNAKITDDARNRYCDKTMGEDIAWLMAPFMDGFYYGYQATGDPKWVAMLVDWTDAWLKRGVKEPDGYVGWPMLGAAGTKVDNLDDFYADSLLSEAMVLRPVVLMSREILRTPKLKAKYGDKAKHYLDVARRQYEKWDRRGAWRETKGGMISLVQPYGIDAKTGKWTPGYETRNDPHAGFSHPNNKANLVALWLLAMSDATGEPKYRQRAEEWFRLMKSRMKLKPDGTFAVWNYWEPAGAWDYKPDGSPKHWVGRHSNAQYYDIDVSAVVEAYRHGLAFTRADIDRLVATAKAEKTYWYALAPFDQEIQQKFEASHEPGSWAGLGTTPCYLTLQRERNP